MKHGAVTDETREMAALYALGALGQHEARAFEDHLAEGCDACWAEVESFDMTVAALALSAVEEEPPAHLRGELQARLNNGALKRKPAPEPVADLLSIQAGEGDWIKVDEGVLLKQLYVDRASGLMTSLVRMMPGTSLPMHRHQGVEQFYILEGDCHVHGEVLGPGDYHRAAAGSIHQETHTVEGTLFLLIAPETYEVLDAR